jgi:Ca2+-binding EF-hand superfamily protein
LYSEEEIENFRCIFDMFDKDKSGFIEVNDLETVMRSLGREPSEAFGLLEGLDIAHDKDSRLSFEEFLKIMKSLENMLVATKEGDGDEILEATNEERIKYGSLLPRTGVHFLPDSKVVDFLK